MGDRQSSYDLERLIRWQESGATWRVLSYRKPTITISLCRCDDETEEVDRLVSEQQDLIDFALANDDMGSPAS